MTDLLLTNLKKEQKREILERIYLIGKYCYNLLKKKENKKILFDQFNRGEIVYLAIYSNHLVYSWLQYNRIVVLFKN